jgi:hypothetical protein
MFGAITSGQAFGDDAQFARCRGIVPRRADHHRHGMRAGTDARVTIEASPRAA